MIPNRAPMPEFWTQIKLTLALLLGSVAYAAILHLVTAYTSEAAVIDMIIYGGVVWLIAGTLSFAVLVGNEFRPERVKIFYGLWSVGIPVVEVLISLRLYADHWVFNAGAVVSARLPVSLSSP